jgi:DNA-directed RNA polymerase subunit E'/Rpb7
MKESCEIRVKIPEDADKEKVESAVREALKTQLTDRTVENCDQITIIVSRHPGASTAGS